MFGKVYLHSGVFSLGVCSHVRGKAFVALTTLKIMKFKFYSSKMTVVQNEGIVFKDY